MWTWNGMECESINIGQDQHRLVRHAYLYHIWLTNPLLLNFYEDFWKIILLLGNVYKTKIFPGPKFIFWPAICYSKWKTTWYPTAFSSLELMIERKEKNLIWKKRPRARKPPKPRGSFWINVWSAFW